MSKIDDAPRGEGQVCEADPHHEAKGRHRVVPEVAELVHGHERRAPVAPRQGQGGRLANSCPF